MQEDKWCIRWVGCDISWWNPGTVVRNSGFVNSVVIFSLVHQAKDQIWKSPKIIKNKELLVAVSLKIVEKFDRKFWNSTASLLGDLYTTPI